jgi:hypothetical protein
MTAEMFFQKAGREHATKQPAGYPFALFCEPVLAGDSLVECLSRNRMGFLGDFRTEGAVREAGIAHPHPVRIRDFRTSRQ